MTKKGFTVAVLTVLFGAVGFIMPYGSAQSQPPPPKIRHTAPPELGGHKSNEEIVIFDSNDVPPPKPLQQESRYTKLERERLHDVDYIAGEQFLHNGTIASHCYFTVGSNNYRFKVKLKRNIEYKLVGVEFEYAGVISEDTFKSIYSNLITRMRHKHIPAEITIGSIGHTIKISF